MVILMTNAAIKSVLHLSEKDPLRANSHLFPETNCLITCSPCSNPVTRIAGGKSATRAFLVKTEFFSFFFPFFFLLFDEFKQSVLLMVNKKLWESETKHCHYTFEKEVTAFTNYNCNLCHVLRGNASSINISFNALRSLLETETM